MKFGIYVIIIIGLIVGAIYLSFQFKRSWNYNWAYESRVQATSTETVCAMVKTEFLKDPNMCKQED